MKTTRQKTQKKNEDQCDEKGCQNSIAYRLTFQSGRLGFYCQHHKELFESLGILVRIESTQKRENYYT